jgi:hypothetical protein
MWRKLIPAAPNTFSLISAFMLVSTSAAQSFAYTQIDVPCAACPGGIALSTSAQGINPAGDIVGQYTDASHNGHGFLLRGGQFTTIDVPGVLVGVAGTLATSASAISPSGDIIGTYIAPVSSAPFGSPAFCPAVGSTACIKGFVYSRGKFSTVLFPLPSGGYHPGAVPRRITSDGDIYGCLHDLDLGMSMFGAAWTRSGDSSLLAGGGELAPSGPLAAPGLPMSMNNGATPDGHTIVGHFTDMMTNHTHGFIVQDGNLHTYDAPGSRLTVIWDINPSDAYVGVYTTDRNHAYLQLPDGSAPIALDLLPGFPANILGASANGINAGGSIVGQYTDSSHVLHGFLAVPLVSY